MADAAPGSSSLRTISLSLPCSPRDLRTDGRASNFVVSSKYTWYNFIPKCLFLQFKRFTNTFFLIICILMVLGTYVDNLFLSPYDPLGTILVLTFVLLVTFIFEGVDDLARHRMDKITNRTPVDVLRTHDQSKVVEACDGLVSKSWGELYPGDVIRISSGELVPADVVLLETSSAGKCYIETSGIDGETNLKIKTVPVQLRHAIDEAGGWAKSTIGKFEYEEPNSFLQFTGSFTRQATATSPEKSFALDFDSLVLRGSKLRNTDWVIAIVTYAGPETKLVKSKKETPNKFSLMDTYVNQTMWITFATFIVFTVLCTLLLLYAYPNTDQWWYFQYTSSIGDFILPGGIAYLFTFAILFSNLIPINILVCLELANFVQAQWIRWDELLFHEETNTRAKVNTGNLVAEIGQVTHVFSDKTGTLTANIMRLVGCSIGGCEYGVSIATAREDSHDVCEELDHTSPSLDGGQATNDERSVEMKPMSSDKFCDLSMDQDQLFEQMVRDYKEHTPHESAIVEFFLALAVCHTVVIDHDAEGNIRYNAEGPDEEALVSAAAHVGVRLTNTDDGTTIVHVDQADGSFKTYTYNVLAVNAFNSTRKRMSLVVEYTDPDEPDREPKLLLLIKGADSVMFERVSPEGTDDTYMKKLNQQLIAYARMGLRTLVVGKREVSREEFEAWQSRYDEAKVQTGTERFAQLSTCAADIEQGIEILGVTAIEDKLQDGVPETIELIREADITLWVLTGDKIETAINIAFSAKLLSSSMYQLRLVSSDRGQLMDEIDEMLRVVGKLRAAENFKDVEAQASLSIDAVESQSAALANDDLSPPAASRSEAFGPDVAVDDFKINELALVISGTALEQLLDVQKGDAASKLKFLELLNVCKVVLACRVSPIQKALIVDLVANGTVMENGVKPVTLAIGDGANDVPMIQHAKIGVGINGREGLQAANNSDFCIAQFRFLSRLLLVHGRWNYRRNVVMLKYIMYSWMVLTYLLILYLFYNLMSGQQVYYNTYYVTMFAWVCNGAAVAIAWLDRDANVESIFAFPKSYVRGRLNLDFSLKQVAILSAAAIVDSAFLWVCVVVFWIPTGSQEVLGAAIYGALFFVMLWQQAVMIRKYTLLVVLALLLAFICFLAGIAILDGVPPFIFQPEGVATTWRQTILCCVLVAMWPVLVFGMHQLYSPSTLRVVDEIDAGYYHGNFVSSKHAIRAFIMNQAAHEVVPRKKKSTADRARALFSRSRLKSLRNLSTRSGFAFDGVSKQESEA